MYKRVNAYTRKGIRCPSVILVFCGPIGRRLRWSYRDGSFRFTWSYGDGSFRFIFDGGTGFIVTSTAVIFDGRNPNA